MSGGTKTLRVARQVLRSAGQAERGRPIGSLAALFEATHRALSAIAVEDARSSGLPRA
jgi:hypothetical protein